MSFKNQMPELVKRVEARLEHWLPNTDVEPLVLHEAMRYSVLGGGKRIRPLLVYATGQSLGIDLDLLDGPAVAIELVHCYSLVHDDLPAMDDDDLRRGQPTTHKKYDEATAILVGDALQMMAFEVLSGDAAMTSDPAARMEIVKILAFACGSRGMTGGQAIDLASEGQTLTEAQLEILHSYKTGYLILASILMACASKPDLDSDIHQRLDQFGRSIGLAFQIRDDLLDVEGSTEKIGKTQGADEAHKKATYPAMLGIDHARARAQTLYDDAMKCLEPLGDAAEPLRTLTDLIVNRDH